MGVTGRQGFCHGIVLPIDPSCGSLASTLLSMTFDDYKVVLYRNQPDGWVAEIPSIAGCHGLMPTPEEALAEVANVFRMIEEEYREIGLPLPTDTTEILHA